MLERRPTSSYDYTIQTIHSILTEFGIIHNIEPAPGTKDLASFNVPDIAFRKYKRWNYKYITNLFRFFNKARKNIRIWWDCVPFDELQGPPATEECLILYWL